MSLFLGKIHYWLFNKILWFENLEEEIIKTAKSEGLDIEGVKSEIEAKYGAKLENKNLEDSLHTTLEKLLQQEKHIDSLEDAILASKQRLPKTKLQKKNSN